MSLCSVAQAAISVLEARSSLRRIFEDFGRAQMSQGQARVELDPDFGAHVRTDDYHVFVAAEGGLRILRPDPWRRGDRSLLFASILRSYLSTMLSADALTPIPSFTMSPSMVLFSTVAFLVSGLSERPESVIRTPSISLFPPKVFSAT